MTPDYKIVAGTTDITEAIKTSLLSLTIEDKAGIESDTLSIELEDSDWQLNIPRRGVKLHAFLGWKETKQLVLMGQYVVDTVEYSFTPNKLVIKAKAADLYLASKEKSLKTRSFDKKSLGNIVDVIANDMGLESAVSDELRGIMINHIDQTDESNLHFITRLAKQHDATAKPAGGKLVFTRSGSGLSASGSPLPSLSIALSDVAKGARLAFAGRPSYDGVTASWRDKKKAKTETITQGGQNRKKLRGNYASKADAVNATKAELRRLQRESVTLQLSLSRGNPLLRAEMHVRTDHSWRKPEAIRKWRVVHCTHKLTRNGGYITSANVENVA